MSKRTSIMASVALAFCLSTPVFADGHAKADMVVATVNGTDITLGHMIVVRAGLPEQYRNLPDDVLFRGILDQLIQQTAMAQLAGDDIPQRVAIALDNERRSLLAAEQMDRVLGETITDDALQELYNERYASAAPEQEFDASHILVETEEEAKALVEELSGGADFAELAKKKSTGPSGPGGGALGWFGKGQMVPSFEAAVAALEKGAVSEPVQTQFGWHVIKLNDTRSKAAPNMDDVRQELEQQLSQSTIEAFINELTSKATITRTPAAEVDPALLKDVSILEK